VLLKKIKISLLLVIQIKSFIVYLTQISKQINVIKRLLKTLDNNTTTDLQILDISKLITLIRQKKKLITLRN
jgi:hypothetical protein